MRDFELSVIKEAQHLERGDYVKIEERIVRVNNVFRENGTISVRGSNARVETYLTPDSRVHVYTKAPR